MFVAGIHYYVEIVITQREFQDLTREKSNAASAKLQVLITKLSYKIILALLILTLIELCLRHLNL